MAGRCRFCKAADAKIVTSFATSPGTRNGAGVWTTDQARQFLAYTKSIDGSIAAVEFMNEPTFAAMGGAPKGYDAAAYGRDIAVFRPFIKETAPEMIFLGPGSVGERMSLAPPSMSILKTEDLDRCSMSSPTIPTERFRNGVRRWGHPQPQLPARRFRRSGSPEWIASRRFMRVFAINFEPGKPLWNTETADAACGGNPWASTFLDTFGYLDQLGRMSKRGVQVNIHNTLASSDYGLLDENTFAPRPNYWAALLWRKLMGTTVLEAGASPAPGLHLYAHCLRGQSGGVALLVINTDTTASRTLSVPIAAERYTLRLSLLRLPFSRCPKPAMVPAGSTRAGSLELLGVGMT